MSSKFFVSKNFNNKHKVISFIYIGRNDLENLIGSLKSVFELSFFPQNIEAIVWIDEDDENYNQFVNSSFMNKYNIKVCVKERVGYKNTSYMFNYMASISSGDFIFPFGADVFLRRKNWDLELYKYKGTDILIFRALLYVIENENFFYDSVGPSHIILTRRVYEILGKISPENLLSDRYLFILSCYCGILEHIYIPVITCDYFLKRIEKNNKEIAERSVLWHETNYSEKSLKLMKEDVYSVREYMDKKCISGRDMPYFHIRYYDRIFENTDKTFAIEMFGGIFGESYIVDFINKKNDDIVFRTNLSSNTWANVFTQHYVDWRINVYQGDTLIYMYDFNLENKKVLIKIESDSIDDISIWLPYVEEFRKKHKCNIFCSMVEKEKFENEYPFIRFINVDEEVICGVMSHEEFIEGKNNSGLLNGNDVFIEYKIGKFGDPLDTNIHPEDYNKIPVGKIASNILGLAY